MLTVVAMGIILQWWLFPFSCWHEYSTWAHGGCARCNLCRWCFSCQPLAQMLNLHSNNLHCVVVVRACASGSGGWWCFPPTHWCRYHTITRATCTVFFCSGGVIVNTILCFKRYTRYYHDASNNRTTVLSSTIKWNGI